MALGDIGAEQRALLPITEFFYKKYQKSI